MTDNGHTEPQLSTQYIDALQRWNGRNSDIRELFRAVISKNGRVSLDDLEPVLDGFMDALGGVSPEGT